MKKYLSLSLLALAMPLLAGAVEGTTGVPIQNSGVDTVISNFGIWVNDLLPILVALAVVFFIFSLLKFLYSAGSKKEEAQSQMIWGIVILFVIVSVWGIVNLFGSTFGIGIDDAPEVDLIPNTTGN